MKLKIENDKFYVLEAGSEKWIYSHEDEAISSLKEMLSTDKQLDEKNVSILEVETKGEKWQVKQLSWSKIALKLLREEKQEWKK